MRISWNPLFKQFETHARIASLGSDVEALKSAGWKSEGPPNWLWVAFRSEHLVKLKKAVPAGITISPEALDRFQQLKAQQEKNAEIKKALKAHRKELNLEDPSKGFKFVLGPEGFMIAEVDPGESRIWHKPVILNRPKQCHVCQSSVYFFELQNPPTCLDCEFDAGL